MKKFLMICLMAITTIAVSAPGVYSYMDGMLQEKVSAPGNGAWFSSEQQYNRCVEVMNEIDYACQSYEDISNPDNFGIEVERDLETKQPTITINYHGQVWIIEPDPVE